MKIKDVPEAEASKLRLIGKLPFNLQVPIDRIIERASTWKEALKNIDMALSDNYGLSPVVINKVRERFKLTGPVGKQRTNKPITGKDRKNERFIRCSKKD